MKFETKLTTVDSLHGTKENLTAEEKKEQAELKKQPEESKK
jgi:hypothetical protein